MPVTFFSRSQSFHGVTACQGVAVVRVLLLFGVILTVTARMGYGSISFCFHFGIVLDDDDDDDDDDYTLCSATCV